LQPPPTDAHGNLALADPDRLPVKQPGSMLTVKAEAVLVFIVLQPQLFAASASAPRML
jgi:hypothetical protein